MEAILSGVQVVLSVILIVLVLLHSGKDTGLSGAFGVGGGAGPLGGGSLVERNLNRWTVAFATLFVINVIVLLRGRSAEAAQPGRLEIERRSRRSTPEAAFLSGRGHGWPQDQYPPKDLGRPDRPTQAPPPVFTFRGLTRRMRVQPCPSQ